MTTARDLSILHTARLAELLHREHDATAEFLVALADFDRRRLWLELGYASLFCFLHQELGLSKGTAHYRKVAAQLVREFPEVVEPLRDGRLCITSIVELANVLTVENRRQVLPRFFHRSRREARALAAEIRPDATAPRREIVTAVGRRATAVGPRDGDAARSVQPVEPDPNGRREAAPTAEGTPPVQGRRREAAELPDVGLQAGAARPDGPPIDPVPTSPPRNAHGSAGLGTARPLEVEPLTAELRRLHVTVSREFLEKLEAARAAMSHARPGARAEEILEAGLDLLLKRHAGRRGLVARPPRSRVARRTGDRSSAVPASVKRAVWRRDGGRCQWPLASGGVCGSTLRVELDHVVPRARGGPSSVENCRLLCRLHNGLAAKLAFGSDWMNRFTRGGPGPAEVPKVSEPEAAWVAEEGAPAQACGPVPGRGPAPRRALPEPVPRTIPATIPPQRRPTIRPSAPTSMSSAAGRSGSPGMSTISPVSAVT